MSVEFSICKFFNPLTRDCLVRNCPCKDCFKIDVCSDLLGSVDAFLECFHKLDDAAKDRALSFLYAKYRVFCKGKE